ncbi:MAG: transglycosylase domain-containing protein, partial [Bryobacteraceae bacterium]
MKTTGKNSSPSRKPKSKASGRGLRLHFPQGAWLGRLFTNPWGKAFLLTFVISTVIGLSVFTYFYVHYSKLIDDKLKAGPFDDRSMLFAAPDPLVVGEETTAAEIASHLRRCGYAESKNSRMGWYQVRGDVIDVYPGPDAYDEEPAVIKFAHNKVSQIVSLRDNTERTRYMLEPELITNLFDRKREKRRIVQFGDIPQVMVNAVLAAEDKRFFAHAGFDPIGLLRAVWVDIRDRRRGQGASTVSMQLARTLWLSTERSWRRKIPEALITLHLEQKLTKQQIFEYYANSIDLGHQGSFAIRGFGEGAQVYFGKDLTQITLPEAATLAGMVQAPSSRNPFRAPEKAKARRDIVLRMMREGGFINQTQYEDAVATDLKVTRGESESTEAPFFVDLVNDLLTSKFQEHDFQGQSYRVYTTLDMNLQRDASAAMRAGLVEVDAALKRRFKGYGTTVPEAQAVLVALDTETGEIKALVGGRNYGQSQLNRSLSKRQPGSVFKPFVYTAAMNTAITEGASQVFTPVSQIQDEPTTFWYDNKSYEPNNHGNHYFGQVSLRTALAKSLNIPAVKVGEAVGFDSIVRIARNAGMNLDIRPTPALALGAYEVTPIEIAGAYTIFPNKGVFIRPTYVKAIRNEKGTDVFESKIERKPVIDPRVAYLMTNLMEEVMRSGTG